MNLSKEIKDKNEQLQIQAMITLLAEKFITDKERMEKLKEVLGMFAVLEMIKEEAREEAREEAIQDSKIEIAKNALKEGATVEFIKKITGLKKKTIQQLQAELNNQ
jgi:predicted transposase/invertase (TIGR01784 family)